MIGENKKALILVSGGIDSTACIDYYLKGGYEITPLFVNYYQLSLANERKAVNKICKYYGLECKEISIKGLTVKSGEIKGRNALFVLSGLNYLNGETGAIVLGIHAGTSYKDCSPDFIDIINNVCNLYENGNIYVTAPFINFSKLEVFKYAQQNNCPLDFTYSCELGANQPCGDCLSCKDLIKLWGQEN